jgi:hypothetical protein
MLVEIPIIHLILEAGHSTFGVKGVVLQNCVKTGYNWEKTSPFERARCSANAPVILEEL